MLILITIIFMILNILFMYIITKIEYLDKDLFRFILTGGMNTFNYYLIYLILFQILYLNYLEAHIIAFLSSAFISFFITTIYTFRKEISFRKFVLFPLTFLPNLIVSTILTMTIVNFNILGEKYATIIAMFLSIPITFIISKKIIASN